MLALVDDEDPVGEREDLVELERDEQDRPALVALLDEPPVDELDRADVEAARRLARRSAPSGRARSRARGRPSAGCRPRARPPRVSGPPPRTSNSAQQPRARGRRGRAAAASRSARPAACRSRAGRCSRRARTRARGRAAGGPAGCARRPRPGSAVRGRVRDVAARRRRRARRSACRRPVIASISSVWPLPSTPAMPDDLAARGPRTRRRGPPASPRSSNTTRSSTVRSGSPGCAGFFSTRSSTSRPTISAREPRLRRALARPRLDELAAPQHGDPVGDLEHLVAACAR